MPKEFFLVKVLKFFYITYFSIYYICTYVKKFLPCQANARRNVSVKIIMFYKTYFTNYNTCIYMYKFYKWSTKS